MPKPIRPTVSTAVLGLFALLLTAFAPAVSASPASQEAQSGRCLEGYAYVEVIGDDHGITSTWCIHQTTCQADLRIGPASDGTSTLKAHYYVSVPTPTSLDPTCYA